MLFEPTQRHYLVCGLRDLPHVSRRDPDFWNLISVLELSGPPVPTAGFPNHIRVACDDVVEAVSGSEAPDSRQIGEVFRFSDRVAGEPLLVHCMFGESRSTAMALLLLLRDMKLDGFSVAESAKESMLFLMTIRPQAKPNPLLLDVGLRMLYSEQEVSVVATTWQKAQS